VEGSVLKAIVVQVSGIDTANLSSDPVRLELGPPSRCCLEKQLFQVDKKPQFIWHGTSKRVTIEGAEAALIADLLMKVWGWQV
jgi:hypothetical protein